MVEAIQMVFKNYWFIYYGLPESFVFETGGRIRQSPRTIDFSALEQERGF